MSKGRCSSNSTCQGFEVLQSRWGNARNCSYLFVECESDEVLLKEGSNFEEGAGAMRVNPRLPPWVGSRLHWGLNTAARFIQALLMKP